MEANTNMDYMVKIPFRRKLGYSFGGATDTIAYDFVAAFLLFFMTDMAGVSPGFAATVVSIGAIWDCITDPIIGNISDKIETRFGKKRTFFVISAPILFVSYLLLFTKFADLDGGAKNAYFLIVALVFWTAYTLFAIPYYSIGATMTMDNTERSKLRMIGQLTQYVGVAISTVAPTAIVTVFLNAGFTPYNAWHYTAWIEAVICLITIAVVFISTKGAELDIKTEEAKEKSNFFQDCKSILRVKPYLIIMASSLCFRIAYCLTISVGMYFFLHVCGLPEIAYSGITAIIAFGGIIIIAIMPKVIDKVPKDKLYGGLLLFSGVLSFVAFLVKPTTIGLLCLFAATYVVGSSAYWSLNMPIMYDSIEIDEFQTGRRREGTATSFYLCMQKVGYAVAAAIIGVVLTAVGYDPALGSNNSAECLNAITSMNYLVPAIFLTISGILGLLYPVKKDVYEKLYAQLENKRAGRPYNTEGFAHVLNKKYR